MNRTAFNFLSIIPATIIISGLIVSACDTPGQKSDPNPQPDGVYHFEAITHDGHHVLCINSGNGSISCDWEHPY